MHVRENRIEEQITGFVNLSFVRWAAITGTLAEEEISKLKNRRGPGKDNIKKRTVQIPTNT